MEADKHWFSDVLTGLVVGGVIGYFDVPPVLTLFGDPFSDPDNPAQPSAWIAPRVGGGELGLRLEARF